MKNSGAKVLVPTRSVAEIERGNTAKLRRAKVRGYLCETEGRWQGARAERGGGGRRRSRHLLGFVDGLIRPAYCIF